MKKIITFISLLLITIIGISFSQERIIEQSMIIDGTIKNAKDGTKVFLVIKDSNYKAHVDSTVIKNQKFLFKKAIADPSEAVILTDSTRSIQDPNKFRIFYTENARLNFVADYDKMFSASIKGGMLNKDFDMYNKGINQLRYFVLGQYMAEMRKPTFRTDPNAGNI